MANDGDLLARGREVAGKLWGARAGGQELPAQKLAPEFFGLVTQFVFGMFWSRPNLDLRSRSLCTVAQLAALPARSAHTFKRRNRNDGTARIIAISGRQRAGTYAIAARRRTARSPSSAARSALCSQNSPGTPFVIAVSTNPNRIVVTCTPRRHSRLRSDSRYVSNAAFDAQ